MDEYPSARGPAGRWSPWLAARGITALALALVGAFALLVSIGGTPEESCNGLGFDGQVAALGVVCVASAALAWFRRPTRTIGRPVSVALCIGSWLCASIGLWYFNHSNVNGCVARHADWYLKAGASCALILLAGWLIGMLPRTRTD